MVAIDLRDSMQGEKAEIFVGYRGISKKRPVFIVVRLPYIVHGSAIFYCWGAPFLDIPQV